MKENIFNLKRFLSLFLALLMIIGMIPLGTLTAFAEDDITVYIKSPSGQSAEFSLPSSTTIGTVKEKIASEFSVSFEDTYRIYCSEVGFPNYKLEDESKTLADYNFRSGYTIHVEKDTWTSTSDQPIKIFGLTITGGTGSQEPYGSYTSVDYYWNYYYKTITIREDTPITISGTAEDGANIIVNNGGWNYLTLDNVTMNETGGACITLNPESWLNLTLIGTNLLTTTPKTENGVVKASPAISLNNDNTYLWINKASTGYLTATTTCDDMPGIGTCKATDTVYGIVIQGGNVTANGGKNAPGVRSNYLSLSGGTLASNGGDGASAGILVHDTDNMENWSSNEGLLNIYANGTVVSNKPLSAATIVNNGTLKFATYEALSSTANYDHANSTGTAYVGTDKYVWSETQSKWIKDPSIPVPVGDFTIVSSDGNIALDETTDYTYKDGVLTVTTATPVIIGMKDGVTATAETIVVDSTNGDAEVNFKNIDIDTDKSAAITAKGANKITFAFTGENALSVTETGYGISVESKTPFVMTSSDNGKLSISDTKFAVWASGYTAGGSFTINGNLNLDITDCASHAIYSGTNKYCGSLTVSGTPVINIDTYEYALYAYGIDISGGKITIRSDEGYPVCSGGGNNITLSGSADLHIVEGEGGLRTDGGKITITDSATYNVYSENTDGDKTAYADVYPLISTSTSGELEISKNAVLELYSANDAISAAKTSVLNNAQIHIVISTESAYSEYAFKFDDTLTISDKAVVDIDVEKGTKVRGLYDSSGTVSVSDSAAVTIDGTTYDGVYVDAINLSENASVTVNAAGDNAIYGAISVNDTAMLTATSVDTRVIYDPCTVTPAEGKVYKVTYGKSKDDTDSEYFTTTGTVNDKSAWRYFNVQTIDFVPITQATVKIDAPVKNGIPDTTAEVSNDAGYTVSAVTWNGNPSKFLGGTAYTATFTLTADSGFAFISDTAVTVEGAVVTKTLNNDGTLSVTAVFPVTEAAVLSSIAVKANPTVVEYTYGDKFDPSGLVITLTNDDGTTEDIAYSDTNKDDFGFSPAVLTTSTTKVTVAYAGKTTDIDVKVGKADLIVKVNNATATYGDAIPNYTVSYDGFVNGDDENDLGGTLGFDCKYAQFSDKGEYTIKASGYISDNYDIEYVDGKLTVSPKAITVTVQNATSIYGNDLAELKATDNGIVNNDTNVYSLATTATGTSNVGKYEIKGTALDSNYDITFANEADAYEITRREVVITVEAKNTIVNTVLPTYTYTVSGLFGEDKLITEPTLISDADITVIGEYDITVSGADAGNNYTIRYVTAKLNVLTDNAVDAANGYGEELKDYNPDTVTSNDRAELEEMLGEIETILDNDDITDNGKKALEEIKDKVKKLLEKIDQAGRATETENTDRVRDITSENVTPEKKTDLENAKADLEKALDEHSGNMTEDEKKAVENEIKRIDDALKVIGNVENVEDTINKLPDNINKDDADAIKAADDSYNDLTDYEKFLVDKDIKQKLDNAKTAIANLNKPADTTSGTTSPNTGDNGNIFLWIALLFVSGGTVIALTVYDKKRKCSNK